MIANAGISTSFKPLAETPVDLVLEHLQVNTLAPLALFQATLPLLKKASGPKFVVISSGVGSNGLISTYAVPFGGYSTSKAAVNHVTAKLAAENPEIVIFPISRMLPLPFRRSSFDQGIAL